MKTIEQIIRDDIGQGGPQLPSDEYEQRIDSILGQMNCAELLTRISNAVAEIGGASGMRLVYSGPVSALRSSTKEAPPATVLYTNYRGETSERTITPIRPWFGSTEWHPEPQWLLRAYDHGKDAERDFALKDFGRQEPSAARKELMKQIREGTAHGFLNDGSQPEGNPDLDCPYCCGSGHKGDVHPSAARELALEEVKTSGATDVRGLIKTYANAAFEQQGNDIPKYIWHLHFEEFAAAIRALSSPDHADAGKVEGDGWKPIESAPKDGTIVLLGWNDPDIEEIGAVAGWYEGGPADKCWYDQYHEPVTATHWMPLRPLPSAPASEGAE